MKKNVGALILSVVLASGSLGGVSVMAAETVEQQTEEVQEEAAYEAVTKAETVQPVDESGVEDPVQQVEGLEPSEEASEPVEVTGDLETEAAGENGAVTAEPSGETDVTAEEGDVEGATPDTSVVTEPEIVEESPAVETDNDNSSSAEGTEIIEEDVKVQQEETKTVGEEATQSETVAVEPSEAEIAANDDVKDASSDLKVAADAEKLKSGKWKEVIKTVHHKEEGHYETVVVKKKVVDEPAWEEDIYEDYLECSECGARFTDAEDAAYHVVAEHNNEASWSNNHDYVDTIYHPEVSHEETVSEKKWVVDKAAWDEQVKTGTYQYIVNGKPVKNKLAAIGNETYYFDANGIAVTGWKEVNGSRMYFGSDRKMKTGWLSVSGKKYYFKTNGQMLTGWLQVNGMKYYFKTSGEMHTGWLQKNGKLYYFKENGQMVTGRYKIGDKWFTFSSDGVKQ